MITTSRSQLYREIWAEPVRTVAARYRISDVALAKLCRRHQVPLPPRGHWAKVRAGQRPKRPALPPVPPDQTAEITIQGNPNSPEAVSDETARLIEAEKQDDKKVQVPEQLIDPHPHVAKAAKSLQAGRADAQGIVSPRARPRLDIRVSRSCLDRALRVMDALCKALEARGYAVEVDEEGKYSTSVVVLEERVFFVMEEQTKRTEHTPTPQERLEAKLYSWKKWPEYDHVLSSSLRLRIVDATYLSVRTTWADGSKQRIENCLNGFIAGVLKVAEAIKRRRFEQAEWEKRRQEDEARRIELQRLQWLDEARQRALEEHAGAWEKVVRIRAYIDRAREAKAVYLPEDAKIETLQQWLEWAAGYANSIDPFRSRPETEAESDTA